MGVRQERFAGSRLDRRTAGSGVGADLVLAPGREVHVGEARPDAVASLGSLTLLKRTEEAGPLGAREVRAYQGVTLVFEPFERAGDPRVAAIYLQ